MVDKRKKALLLGMGLDGNDGQKRITVGENYYLLGGSQETHTVMQEKAIKFNEVLKKKGKQLAEIEKDEFYEIADKIGMLAGKIPKRKEGQDE